MERRRQLAAPQNRNAAVRFDEIELAIEPDPVADTQPPVEIEQVDAAAKQNVLAVVDGFSRLIGRGRHRIGSGAAAQERARFEEFHIEAGSSQSGGCRHPGQSSPRNENFRHQNASMAPFVYPTPTMASSVACAMG